MIKYILFDMDGLLLDTERVYTEVTQEIVAKYGKSFDWNLKAKMMGQKESDAADILIKTLDIPMTREEYLKQRNEGHANKFPHCKPLPGVLNLVFHLKSMQVPIAVATSSHRKAFLLKSQNNQDLFSKFQSITCGDDSPDLRGKPFPDIFLKSAKKLSGKDTIDPAEFLVFEDAPSGVLAGLNAGMKVIWIPDPNLEVDRELASRCLFVLKSMEEFKPESVGLTPF